MIHYIDLIEILDSYKKVPNYVFNKSHIYDWTYFTNFTMGLATIYKGTDIIYFRKFSCGAPGYLLEWRHGRIEFTNIIDNPDKKYVFDQVLNRLDKDYPKIYGLK
jgi:hypothetical protein